MAAKILLAALLAVPAMAKTDMEGCTSYDSILYAGNSPYVSKIFYLPDTGEVCEFLDCGGGRAPPKTTVPGCGSYEGTETYSPRFINPKTLGGVASETGAAGSDTEDATATITEAPSSTGEAGSKTTDGSEEDETTTEDEETTTAEEASTAEDTTAEETTAVEQTTTTKDASKTITTVTTQATTPAGSGAASSGSESEAEAAATPAASTVSTGGAVMPTAGALLGSCLMAGAMYAGLL
ncbi:hypothetical protein N0V84_001406 [Fusarium piperis]|uniref:Cell wall protein n=1 Tax=Fusarium piperis TaxID=1435070 RepID=A0A9W9BTD6_9HYPO|nr:hypothetical protein N0V84_001406 [Fusarium piperis]